MSFNEGLSIEIQTLNGLNSLIVFYILLKENGSIFLSDLSFKSLTNLSNFYLNPSTIVAYKYLLLNGVTALSNVMWAINMCFINQLTISSEKLVIYLSWTFMDADWTLSTLGKIGKAMVTLPNHKNHFIKWVLDKINNALEKYHLIVFNIYLRTSLFDFLLKSKNLNELFKKFNQIQTKNLIF